ncbi:MULTISPECIES: thioredoxin family protein [Bacillaceae]|uniref:Thioredoxin family protein n=1 Tax=Evansella alkalicola TaxID=745819 RepID=A0ABS6JTF6_9BACI|nr:MULTISPECIES: thioredoxin family protein [Bacillaceae]MBU9721873.1 thioredoxin family protein [Bacillus alkalicola]
MKKIIIFSIIILSIFGALIFITNYQTTQQVEGNPFGKDRLHPETVKQLNDPYYQNIILPHELAEIIDAEEDVTVYFYSPTCEYCGVATPRIVDAAEAAGVEVKLFNLEEFREGWDQYEVEYTPTLIHYEAGQEREPRMVGAYEQEVYEQFYQEIVLN